jgi:hypothetical protein
MFVALLVIAACGDDSTATDPPGTTTDGAATTTSPDTAVSTTGDDPAATATTESPSTEAPTTAQPPEPVPAAELLAPFFLAAEDLDTRIRAAADLYNSTYDAATGLAGDDAMEAIAGLDATSAGRLIPGGLTSEVETAALMVFSDLESRIAALVGGARSFAAGGDDTCFAIGGESARRFAADLQAARDLAAAGSAVVLGPDAPEAGMVAVRAAYIHGANWCCDGCGGFIYEAPIAIDWEGGIYAPGGVNAPFEAVFNGYYWQVVFPQAGAGSAGPITFRPGGLGIVAFGDPPAWVISAVESTLGFPPTADSGWIPSSEVAPVCPGPTVRIVEWDSLGILFADDGYFAPPGTEQFVAYWHYGVPPWVGTQDGVGVGATVTDLLAVHPDALITSESGRFGPTFSIAGGDGELLWGELTGVSGADEITSISGGIGCGD